MVKTTVDVTVDTKVPYFVGGDEVTGTVLITTDDTKGLEIKNLHVSVVCEIFVSIGKKEGIDMAKKKKTDEKIEKKLVIYENSSEIFDGRQILTPGGHPFLFSFKLPDQHPTLPPSMHNETKKGTIGSVNYYISARLKRTKNSIFNKSELKAKSLPFQVVPVQFISNPETIKDVEDIDFSTFANEPTGGSITSELKKLFTSNSENGSVSGILSQLSARKQDPKVALFCTLKLPSRGLQQSQPFDMGLIVRPANEGEKIMIKWVSVTVETIMSITIDKYQSESIVGSTILTQTQPMIKGGLVDISESLKALVFRQPITPTFTTPLLSCIHRITINATVLRDIDNIVAEAYTNVSHTVPVVVFSPVIKGKDTSVPSKINEEKRPNGDHKSYPRDSKNTQTPPSYEEST